MNYFTVFVTILSKKAGQLLTANLVEKRCGVSPIEVAEDEFNAVYDEGDYATLMAFEITCDLDDAHDVKDLIADELKALTASYHSLVVVDGGEHGIAWGGPVVAVQPSVSPAKPEPPRFRTID
jgi:hypothetical protein